MYGGGRGGCCRIAGAGLGRRAQVRCCRICRGGVDAGCRRHRSGRVPTLAAPGHRQVGGALMPLVSGAEVVLAAAKAGRGVGAFNVIQLEHATALIAGAEQVGAPVILQISENAVRYHGALKPIGVAKLAAAADASGPVVVHLDHAMDRDLVTEAVSLGFTSVMYDASKLEYADNVAATTEVTTYCHERGVFVEAEIAEVGGKDGEHAPGAPTRPHAR